MTGVPWPIGRDKVARTIVDVGAQSDAAHGFYTTGNANIDGTARDHRRDHVVGRLGRAALVVQSGAAGGIVFAECEPCIAGDITRLLARLGDTATGKVVHVSIF